MMKRELVLYFKSWHQLPKSDLVKGSNNVLSQQKSDTPCIKAGVKNKITGWLYPIQSFVPLLQWLEGTEVLPGTFPSNNFFSPLICENFFLKLNSQA